MVEVREKSRDIEVIKKAIEFNRERNTVPWIEVDFDNYKGTFLRYPRLEEVTDLPVDLQTVIEFYSR